MTDRDAKAPSLRERVRDELDPIAKVQLSPLNKLIAVLIVASVLLGILGTEPILRDELGYWLPLIEAGFGVAFLFELIARVWSAGADQRFAGVAGALRYLTKPLPLFDLLVIATLILPAFGAEFAVLRLLRILRIVALAKFGRYSEALTLLGAAVYRRRYELTMSIVIANLIFLLSATVMYLVEGDIQPEAFGSIPRALWWSMVTLTTVGYGDVYPITLLGRICGGVTAFAGIGLIAMPAGIIASSFSELTSKAKE